MKPTLSIIVALCKNKAIGKNNQLLFKIKNDLKRFKKITENHPVIMGRKTFESIGKALPNRTNIIITKDKNYPNCGIIVVNSLEEAIKKAKQIDNNEIFIIGGGQIYHQAITLADKLYLTMINEEIKNADTFFPNFENFTKTIFEETHNEDGVEYKFLELLR